MAEPSFMNSAIVKVMRTQLDAGDVRQMTQ
jgi:hypothetical protein